MQEGCYKSVCGCGGTNLRILMRSRRSGQSEKALSMILAGGEKADVDSIIPMCCDRQKCFEVEDKGWRWKGRQNLCYNQIYNLVGWEDRAFIN